MNRTLRLATLLLVPASLPAQTSIQIISLAPATMPRTGTVSPRFQGYNIEMVEVTGGRFWAPYKLGSDAAAKPDSKLETPGGMDPSLYRYRQPIDLANPRLRKLAAALAPAYLRVSGTWANSTFFQDSNAPAPDKAPEGFGSVLTRKEWKGVVDFSKAVDAPIVTSFAISQGVRNSDGVWAPAEAKKLLSYTRTIGGSIAAAEMFNEPTFASMGGAPKGYDAAAYGRDFRAFHSYVRSAAPKMVVLGPGGVGDLGIGQTETPVAGARIVRSEDMLREEGPGLDGFSYHFYGGVSQRCKQMGAAMQTTPDTALTEAWLNKTNRDADFYADLRDKYAPGKPLWLTETGETACGGNPWASTFIDSFRYLNQLGTLARKGVQAVIHNTLAASDYALIDEQTLNPRPNYWAALLWSRLMGTTVLNAAPAAASSSPAPETSLYLYAHCLKQTSSAKSSTGGVAILAINASRTATQTISLPAASTRYTLASDNLLSNRATLNGVDLALTPQGNLPTLTGTPTPSGEITLQPTTITFFEVPQANNPACRR